MTLQTLMPSRPMSPGALPREAHGKAASLLPYGGSVARLRLASLGLRRYRVAYDGALRRAESLVTAPYDVLNRLRRRLETCGA
jgi:hypothetical protein